MTYWVEGMNVYLEGVNLVDDRCPWDGPSDMLERVSGDQHSQWYLNQQEDFCENVVATVLQRFVHHHLIDLHLFYHY